MNLSQSRDSLELELKEQAEVTGAAVGEEGDAAGWVCDGGLVEVKKSWTPPCWRTCPGRDARHLGQHKGRKTSLSVWVYVCGGGKHTEGQQQQQSDRKDNKGQ